VTRTRARQSQVCSARETDGSTFEIPLNNAILAVGSVYIY
jgi:hypothetical protein